MKTTLLLTPLLFFSLFATSQITKGSLLLGGNIYATKAEYKQDTNIITQNNNLSFSASGGKAVRTNTIVGIYGYYSASRNEYDNSENIQKNREFGTGVFIRQYIP